MPSHSGSMPNRSRAIKLLFGGSIAGSLAWLLATLLWWSALGRPALAGALVGGAITLGFFSIGQFAQVVFAESSPVRVMTVTMISYVVRIVGAVAAAGLVSERLAQLNRVALAVTVIAVAIAWIVGEIIAFARLRIPAFDPPSD